MNILDRYNSFIESVSDSYNEFIKECNKKLDLGLEPISCQKINNVNYDNKYEEKLKYIINKHIEDINNICLEDIMTNNDDLKEYLVPKQLSAVCLDVKDSFAQLTDREKMYAYYMHKASWAGASITTLQVSPESHKLISFFAWLLDQHANKNSLRDDLLTVFSEDDVNGFFNYVAMLFSNFGNYLSYGDKKFIPNIDKKVFIDIILAIMKIEDTYYGLESIVDTVYSLTNNNRSLNIYPSGVTCYYSPNMTDSDIQLVDEYMNYKNLEPWNTRLEKNKNSSYTIHIASAKSKVVNDKYKDSSITIKYGDYSRYLENVIIYLEEAKKYAANENQVKMLEAYIEHFMYGDINKHKGSQIYWVKDKGPSVETNLGFIENYRDPKGVRSEFESFVAFVDKDISKKYAELVDVAPELLGLLPWPKCLEKDTFLKPDFTSLNVLTFVSSGIPLGINIPNYDDIRQNLGFKNVSLGNVIKSAFKNSDPEKKIIYLTEEDSNLYKKYIDSAYELQVAGHELLGHGSGKLLYLNKDGTFNFDCKNEMLSNLTCYTEGQTYSNVFGTLGNPFEECRAECVGLFFSTVKQMHQVFKCESDFEDICYVNWLSMIRSGLTSLLSYNPEDKRWLQAHSQARFVIFRVLNEIPDFINIIKMVDSTTNTDGTDDTNGSLQFNVTVKRDMVLNEGVKRLCEFLYKLQLFKASADIKNATKMFSNYSVVDDHYLELRNIVMNNYKPKPLFVQPTLVKSDGIQIIEYESSIDGMIESFIRNTYKFS